MLIFLLIFLILEHCCFFFVSSMLRFYFPGNLKPVGQNWPSGVSPKTPKTIPATAMIVASPMMMPGRYRRLGELDFSWDLLAVEASLEQLLADILLKIFRELKVSCLQLLALKRIMPFPRIWNMLKILEVIIKILQRTSTFN